VNFSDPEVNTVNELRLLALAPANGARFTKSKMCHNAVKNELVATEWGKAAF
jgi:hypothetical protein